MDLLTKTWKGENIKAVIKLSDKVEYIVYTNKENNNSNNFIKELKFENSEGNNSVNPLGVAVSNSITLQVYDEDDALSPMNTSSKYYGLTVNGVEIDLFIEYEEGVWSPYGIYFTTYWGGSYSDGGHGLVNISADDKLNTLGALDLPDVPAFAGVEAGNLIAYVMYGLGLSDSQFKIDPSINTTLEYGIVQGTKVRDFLNNICQILMARVIVDREGVIKFVPALGVYVDGNSLEITSEESGALVNKNNNNINYSKVRVKYLEAGETSFETLFSDSSHVLNEGLNVITDINVRFRALSYDNVNVLFNSTEQGANINSISWRGYQNGIQLNVNVTGGAISECRITGEGTAVSTVDRYIEKSIENSTSFGGTTFLFDTQQMMSKSKAEALGEQLKIYIKTVQRNVIMSGCALTPKLNIGDKLIIKDTGTLYDGTYKVVGQSLTFGEDYNMDLTLIRLEV